MTIRRKTDEDPIESDSFREGKQYSHPAFAQITVSRVSGSSVLYGSDFEHHNYVVLRIAKSVLDRSLSHDSYFAGVAHSYIEVAMSESQWATFVSSFNIGEGVPCTVQRRDGNMIPTIPLRDAGQEYAKEENEALMSALAALEKSRARIVENVAGLSQKKQADALAGLDEAIRTLISTMPFIADSFSKFMGKRAEKAKVEVNAYINGQIHSAGLAALGAVNSPFSLPGGDAPKAIENRRKNTR